MNLFICRTKLNDLIDGAEYADAQFDFSEACPLCASNFKIVGDYPIKKVPKKDFFETSLLDTIISENMVNQLIKHNLPIEKNLRKVIHYRKKYFLNYYQLYSNVFLPKLSDKTEGINNAAHCSNCHRGGFFDDLKYDNISKKYYQNQKYIYDTLFKEVLRSNDIFYSWEYFGYTNLKREGYKLIKYPRPKLIVSSRFKDAIESLKIKNVIFEEIIVKQWV